MIGRSSRSKNSLGSLKLFSNKVNINVKIERGRRKSDNNRDRAPLFKNSKTDQQIQTDSLSEPQCKDIMRLLATTEFLQVIAFLGSGPKGDNVL